MCDTFLLSFSAAFASGLVSCLYLVKSAVIFVSDLFLRPCCILILV